MHFSRLPVLVLVALPLLSIGALAQQTDAGIDSVQPALPDMASIEQAWARGDFVVVRHGLQQLAENSDDALAYYRYGRVLIEGRGGPVDIPNAVKWLEKAVAKNHLEASTLLARVYLTGMPGGVERDPVRAAKLLAGTAARGDAEAQYYLGLLYRSGQGVEQDATAAFNWFLAAAEQQYVAAQYELARAYSRGEGTAKDDVQGLSWLLSAAENGHVEAQFFVAMAYDTGRGAPQNDGLAMRWYRRSAEAGFIVSQRRLGEKYLKGQGVDPNLSEAMRWLGKAAQAGDMRATYVLGQAYLGQMGLPANPEKAWALFSQAAKGGYARGLTAMAEMLESGVTGTVDLAQAVTFYRKAVKQGDEQALLRLGALAGAGKLEGLAPPHLAVPWAMEAGRQGDQAALDWVAGQAEQNLRPAQTAYGLWLLEQGQSDRAAEFLARSAQAGDVEGQYQLGMMLTKGDGVEMDYVQAHAWLNIAAAGGHPEAAKMRGVINDLMTPEQVAEAQKRARDYFDAVANAPVEAGR